MKVAMLAPIAWRTPPRHYGPWELVSHLLTEELVGKGVNVTLFATRDSWTSARLDAVCPRGYEEDRSIDAKVWECLHIANCFDKADQFDIIHNQFDFLPLTYGGLVKTPLVTTIHGFSSSRILPVYEKYNRSTYYVSISDADRAESLDYIDTVYHGIDIRQFAFNDSPEEYLLFFGRIHPDKGARESIEIARACGKKLVMAGIIQDRAYYEEHVEPSLDGDAVTYVGSVGPERRDQLLRNAAALLHPIRFDEPFGLSIVEAMACGTPTIAFKRGSMPELIEDGRTGMLVSNVAQAVAAVGRIGNIRRQDCRRTAEERFSVSTMADNYIRVYERILSGKRTEK